MNPDHYLRAPRLPRFPVVETFEDLPALYLLYYNEPPLPYATPTPGIVVQDLRTLLGLPIHNLPLSIVNTSFPLDEIVLASTVMDEMQILLPWPLFLRPNSTPWFSCHPLTWPLWPGDKHYAEFLLFFATRPFLNIILTEMCILCI